METVDNQVLPITAGKFCDHVGARGLWLRGSTPVIVVAAPYVHIVIEEGVVKILCHNCFLRAIQISLPIN